MIIGSNPCYVFRVDDLSMRAATAADTSFLWRMLSFAAYARSQYPAIALTVREGNAAVRLYEGFSFVEESRVTNRVDGVSIGMRRALAEG
jgi:hypothetical protein